MDIRDIEIDLRRRLSKKRFEHTLGVVVTSVDLARKYGENLEYARLAALLHDSAKELSLLDMQNLVKNFNLDDDMLRNRALLHGIAGMELAKERYGVTNSYILEAIRVHTTGKVNMSTLDKIIFLADYIEPNRDFPGLDIIRLAAKESLDKGVLAGYDMTIRHLLDQGLSIYPLTILGRNDIIRSIKGG